MLPKSLVVLVWSAVVVVVVMRAEGGEGQGYEGWRLVRFCGRSRALKKQPWLESLKEEGDRDDILWLGTHHDAVSILTPLLHRFYPFASSTISSSSLPVPLVLVVSPTLCYLQPSPYGVFQA